MKYVKRPVEHAYIKVAAWPISRASLSACVRICERSWDSRASTGPTTDRTSCHADVLAKSRRKRTMLGRIVKRDCAIEMRSALRDISRTARNADEAMPDHKRGGRPLLFGERQELRRKLASRRR